MLLKQNIPGRFCLLSETLISPVNPMKMLLGICIALEKKGPFKLRMYLSAFEGTPIHGQIYFQLAFIYYPSNIELESMDVIEVWFSMKSD